MCTSSTLAVPSGNELADQAARIHYESGNRLSEFSCLMTLCVAQRESGLTEQSFVVVRRALEVAEQLGGSLREALALVELGTLYGRARSWDEAIASYGRAVILYHRGGDRIGEARALEAMAGTCRAMGRPEDAVRFYTRAIENYRSGTHYRSSLAHCLYLLGELHRDAGRIEQARREHGEVLEVLRGSTDIGSVDLRKRTESLLRSDRI